MSKFNVAVPNSRRTLNEEGGVAYNMLNPEMDLYATSACYMVSNTFYTSEENTTERIIDLVAKCDADYVAALASYIRNKMYMRSVPLILLSALATTGRLKEHMIPPVVVRADEITELLAAWQKFSGKGNLKKMPNALKRGIAACFHKFSSYHFRKYNRQGKGQITFKDAMRISHPKPRDDIEQETFKAIKEDNLPPIETWEVALSSNSKSKKETWEELIDNDSIPYMAILRNLMNMIKAEISPEHTKKVCEKLTDRDLIINSKQFPFRWYSAYKMLVTNPKTAAFKLRYLLLDALKTAIQTSIANVEWFNSTDRLLIACDVSGSMRYPISPRSQITYMDIGLVLGSLAHNNNRSSILGVFGRYWAPIPDPQIFNLSYPEVGFATEGHKVIDWALQHKYNFDRFLFFSDDQIYSLNCKINEMPEFFRKDPLGSAFEAYWNTYKNNVNPRARCYLFNLSCHSNTPIDTLRNDVYFVTGWSEKIFAALDSIHKWKETRAMIMRG